VERRAPSEGKAIRGLQRGIAVMRALQDEPGLSLRELHARTGLAKPTLLRVLRTLEGAGWVWRAIGDGLYRNSMLVRELSPAQRKFQRLGEVAAPHLEALQRKVVWPSDLVVRHGYYMEVVETSRPHCTVGVYRDRIGQRVDMLWSAVGRAYLAFCPAREREQIVGWLARHPQARIEAGAIDTAYLQRVLAETRARGYGARDPRYGGRDKGKEEYDDKLQAIAVPIQSRRAVLGCLNIVWLERFKLEADVARKHLGALREAARGIAQDVERGALA
jgi:IclR family mhp operon transcriptional activator